MKKNDVLKVLITGYSFDGYGVCKPGGYVLFVPSAIKGETLLVKVLKATKTYGYAKILEIIDPSPDRVAPLCASFEKCGGCQFWHMNYKAEKELKKELVNGLFERAGFNRPVKEVLSTGVITGYRNKAQYPIRQQNGVIKSGFFAPHSHRVIECSCLIQPPVFEKLRQSVIDFLNKYKIEGYDEVNHTGIARGLYLRSTADNSNIMLALIINGKHFKYENELVKHLTCAFDNITTVLLNYNESRNNTVLGPGFKTLYGSGSLTDTLNKKRISFGAGCFYQVNHGACELLYQKAAMLLKDAAGGRVIDLFCGVGSIGICSAPGAAQLIGVESFEPAVKYARLNARQNNIAGASFIFEKTENALALKNIKADAVIVDPPRSGLKPGAIQLLLDISPPSIVYISCNPQTLCRDLVMLTKYYKIENVLAVDMFARTAHVETVVKLTKIS